MRGRKPLPATLHELHGNPSKRARNRAPKAAIAAPLEPPEPVLGDEDAMEEWRRLTAALQATGGVTVGDRGVLAMLCTLYANWIEAERQLVATGGPVIRGRDKGLVRNPWTLIRNRAIELYMRASGEFGRSRLGATVLPPAESPDAGDDAGPDRMSLQEYLALGQRIREGEPWPT